MGAARTGCRDCATTLDVGKDSTTREARPIEMFIVDLGLALHRYGASTARIEAAMTELASRLDVDAQFFVQPTALFASFGRAGRETILRRLGPSVTDLTRLERLDALLVALLRG